MKNESYFQGMKVTLILHSMRSEILEGQSLYQPNCQLRHQVIPFPFCSSLLVQKTMSAGQTTRVIRARSSSLPREKLISAAWKVHVGRVSRLGLSGLPIIPRPWNNYSITMEQTQPTALSPEFTGRGGSFRQRECRGLPARVGSFPSRFPGAEAWKNGEMGGVGWLFLLGWLVMDA